MRTILLTAVLALFAVSSVASAASSGRLGAVFTVHFPQGHPASNAPCDPDTFCGVGEVTGFGPATVTILDETFDDIAGSTCLAVTRTESVDLLRGSGSLKLDSAGTFCRPGGSGESNAGPSSYGSPGRFDLTYTIDGAGSTGSFAGTSGSGVETMKVDGGVGVWQLAGSLVQP